MPIFLHAGVLESSARNTFMWVPTRTLFTLIKFFMFAFDFERKEKYSLFIKLIVNNLKFDIFFYYYVSVGLKPITKLQMETSSEKLFTHTRVHTLSNTHSNTHTHTHTLVLRH